MNYWQGRSFDITKEIFADSESYVKFIHGEYEKAINELDKRIVNHLNAMSSEQGVSILEANKLLNNAERIDLQDFINNASGKITPEIEKKLNLASRRVRISRLQAMELEIKTSVSKLLSTEEKKLFAHLSNVFDKKYYNELYGLQRVMGYENIFKINDSELRQIILNPWAVDGSNFSQRIWGRGDKLINVLRSNLTRSIMVGHSNDVIIRDISKTMNVSKANAGRLIMTESAAMNSKATQHAYKTMSTKKYEILSTLDLKTSYICQEMDNKVFEVKNYIVGTTAPPFHPNCRTTTIPYFDDDLGLDDTRIARNSSTGRSEKVQDMPYKSWYSKYVVDNANSGIDIDVLLQRESELVNKLKQLQKDSNDINNDIIFGDFSPETLAKSEQINNKISDIKNQLSDVSKQIKDITGRAGEYERKENFDKVYKLVRNHGLTTGNECLCWTDLDGNEIMPHKFGSKNGVYLSDDMVKGLTEGQKNTIISIHNHPESTSFSPEDIVLACRYESIKEMQVVGNDGTKYILDLSTGTRPDDSRVKDAFHEFRIKVQSKYQKMYNETKNKKLVVKEFSNEIVENMSNRFGWTYRRELNG